MGVVPNVAQIATNNARTFAEKLGQFSMTSFSSESKSAALFAAPIVEATRFSEDFADIASPVSPTTFMRKQRGEMQ